MKCNICGSDLCELKSIKFPDRISNMPNVDSTTILAKCTNENCSDFNIRRVFMKLTQKKR